LGYFRPEMSGSLVICEFRLIVLARRLGFGELRVPGRFVDLGEGIFVYCMLRCVFWVVSDLVRTLEVLTFVYCMRWVFVGGFD
jgi:hypothetical protein